MSDRNDLKLRAQEIFRDCLNAPNLQLFDSMVAKDVENWDSLNHITLVMSLEEAFHVSFTTKEVMGWRNVGEMLDTLTTKLDQAH